jgi:glycosyltransferase involved in cell wall biosynthesis
MRIAINTRFSAYPYEEGYGRYTREIAGRMADLCPDDQFLFLYDQQPAWGNRPRETGGFGNGSPMPERPAQRFHGAHISHRVMGPPARHPLLWKFWYDIRVPAALRKAGADVFFSPDGICSLTASVPQVLVIHDLAYLHFPDALPGFQQRYYRSQTPRFIRKAARIITVSEFSRQDILRHYPQAQGKIEVVPNAAEDAFRTLDWHEREAVKEKFTGGMEYFIYTGSIHPRKNLLNLLKAFSAFKKRQKTGMKLVLAGRLAWQHEAFTEALSRYKYRNDVWLAGYQPEETFRQLLGAAYALVYPSLWEGFGMPLLEAMKSGVPVLCSNTSAMPETAADAALLFDPLDPDDIGRQMTKIYIDETERARLIERGLERSSLYHWDRSAARIREILGEAAGGKINAYLRG